jgi:hypothetical protein
MSYTEDVTTLVYLEKARLLALIVAMGSSFASVAFDMDWLLWPRALGWAAATVICGFEARAEKRLGRDPDGSWLRVVLFGFIAATCFVSAWRA